MRTTNQIIIAVRENQPVEDRELRLALLALASIDTFRQTDLDGLIEAIQAEKPIGLLKLKAQFADRRRESMFQAIKTDPEKWLGPDGIPGTPAHDERYAASKRLLKNATGIDA